MGRGWNDVIFVGGLGFGVLAVRLKDPYAAGFGNEFKSLKNIFYIRVLLRPVPQKFWSFSKYDIHNWHTHFSQSLCLFPLLNDQPYVLSTNAQVIN